MSLIDDAKMYARFTREMQRFLKHRLSEEEASAIVRDRMAKRQENFLRLVKRAVYGYPSSPYLALLKHAQCDFDDLAARVRETGLTGTLCELREAGVYVDLEEFKGRAPIVRDRLELRVKASDFDNPFLAGHFIKESGGSTGVGTRTSQDLDHYAALAPHQMLARAAHGVLDVPFVLWRGILPDGSGMNNVLQSTYYGRPPALWFSQLAPFATKHVKYTLASYSFVLLGRVNGAPIPLPRYVPLERAVVVARAIAGLVHKHGGCLVGTVVSRAVRICLAAAEHGIDIAGATFLIAGEPLTPAKAQVIQAAGARCYTNYGMEVGRIAHGCARSTDATDVHVARDAIEVFSRPMNVPGFDVNVPILNFTTLLPSTPKILMNAQMDDYAILETRECGCALERLGWNVHLRQIKSYRKLTGEGVTLIGSEMIHILEVVLPLKFGGTPLDYQLVEQEDERGLTRLYLVISPRIVIADEQKVLATVNRALRESSVAADAARAIWQQANIFQIKRTEPIWSKRGKFSPLILSRRGEFPAPETR